MDRNVNIITDLDGNRIADTNEVVYIGSDLPCLHLLKAVK